MLVTDYLKIAILPLSRELGQMTLEISSKSVAQQQ